MAHATQEEIIKEINKARKLVEVGSLYAHYKHPDQYYVIESIGCVEETEQPCVCYRALYDKGILWVRTLKNFLEKVEADGKKVSRFKKC